MADLDEQDCRLLLQVARDEIASRLSGNPPPPNPQFSDAVYRIQGCFVTLQQNGQLRGCIGTIEAVSPLIDCVKENAVHAAYRDPRFKPISRSDLNAVVIEISVLSPPQQIHFESSAQLLDLLHPGVHGVILSKGGRRATFLPQVWEQLPDKKAFLAHLCQKAGLGADCWKSKGLRVDIYEVIHFSES